MTLEQEDGFEEEVPETEAVEAEVEIDVPEVDEPQEDDSEAEADGADDNEEISSEEAEEIADEVEETAEDMIGEVADADETVIMAPVDTDIQQAEEVAEEPSEEEKPKKSKKGALIACGSVAGVLAVAYLGGALFFSSHFFPNTTINGEDVSMMSTSEVASNVNAQIQEYAPVVVGNGLELTLDLNKIAFGTDTDGFVKAAKDQENCLAWPVELSGNHELASTNEVTYDSKTLATVLQEQIAKINETGTDPTNATIEYDKKQKQFVAVAGEKGSMLDLQAVLNTVETGLKELKPIIEIGDENLKQPEITVDCDKMVAALEKANSLINPITFKYKSNDVYTMGPALLNNWVSINPDTLEVTFNEDSARLWLDSTLSSKVNSAGSVRTYKDEKGDKVEVSGGTYGWKFDLSETTNTAIGLINEGKGGEIKLKALSKADKWNPGGRDWDGPYVDVDLGDQYARLYNEKGEVIWESDIVSGNTSAGHSTPTGVYVINYMGRDVTLVGSDQNGDGEPDYRSPVSYWMPFVDNSVGLHDANWRGEFGGSIYAYNGSHGCVNLPPYKAAELYELISVGTVVSCHW